MLKSLSKSPSEGTNKNDNLLKAKSINDLQIMKTKKCSLNLDNSNL